MKTVRRRGAFGSFSFVAVLVLAVLSGSAYIDAGSGSYIFQLLVGALAGAVMAVGVFWRRIRAALGKLFSRKG